METECLTGLGPHHVPCGAGTAQPPNTTCGPERRTGLPTTEVAAPWSQCQRAPSPAVPHGAAQAPAGLLTTSGSVCPVQWVSLSLFC